MNKKILWVDDIRDPKIIKNQEPEADITWAKTFSEAYELLENCDYFDAIYLDNDLGDENDREGADLLNFIDERLYFNLIYGISAIFVHSDNASSVQRMMSAKSRFQDVYNIKLSQLIFNKKDYLV